MNRKNQKYKEKYFAEEFLKQTEFPKGELISQEEPDFVYFCDNSFKIGIEITEFHIRKNISEIFSPSMRQGTIDKIVKNAENLFNENNNLNLNVNFHFFNNLQINKKRRLELASELSIIIEKVVQKNSFLDWFTFKIEEKLPKEVKHIYGHFHPISDVSIWHSSEAKWLPDLKISDIDSILKKKEEKVNSYKLSCDEIILLIIEGISLNSSFYRYEDVLNHNKFNSKFDKIFIFRNLSKKLIKIK